MINYSIFFSFDSLKLHDGYTPQLSDVINVVAVESIQFYLESNFYDFSEKVLIRK